MNRRHRIANLETIWPPPAPLVSRFRHPWLETLTDADLDVMDEVLSHLESGGDADTLSPAVRERYAVLNAAQSTWAEGRAT